MSYIDTTFEEHPGMKCPQCGRMIYEYTQYWGVNLDCEEQDEWDSQGPHAAFDCPGCGLRFYPEHL